MEKVPGSLRAWFVIHFVVDMIFGIPLFVAPSVTMVLLGFTPVNVIFAQLLGAGLLGIGGASFLMRHAGSDVYRAMLDLKIIWSFSAIVALFLVLQAQFSLFAFIVLGLFVLFSAVWISYRRKL